MRWLKLIFCLAVWTVRCPAEATDRGVDDLTVGKQRDKRYLSFEIRHQTNTYHDLQNRYLHQDPSLHMVLRTGLHSLEDRLDGYLTVGFIKVPNTQKVIVRRPELGLDFYWWKERKFHISSFNLIKLPFSDGDFDDQNLIPRFQGAIFSPGIAAIFYPRTHLSAGELGFTSGVDIWGEFYSRRQFIDRKIDWIEENGNDLVEDRVQGQKMEAVKSPLFTRWFAGMVLRPVFFRELLIRATTYYDISHVPRYTFSHSGVIEEYGKKIASFYLVKIEYKISDNFRIMSQFYQYYKDFFRDTVVGSEERRNRSILRLAWRL